MNNKEYKEVAAAQIKLDNCKVILIGGITEYTECQAFCPFVGIGSPHPLTRKRMSPPPWFLSL